MVEELFAREKCTKPEKSEKMEEISHNHYVSLYKTLTK